MNASGCPARAVWAAPIVLVLVVSILSALSVLGCAEDGPATAAERHLAQAEAHLRAGELAQALTALKAVQGADPQGAAPHLRLGRLYLDLGDAASAAKALERARQLEPQMAEARHLLGRAWLMLGAYDRVLAELSLTDEAMALGRAETNLLHGRAHLAQGDRGAARQDFEQALARQPELSQGYGGLARVAIAAGDMEQAEEYLRKAMGGVGVQYVEILTAEGELALARGDLRAAKDAFERAVNLRPGEAWRRHDLIRVQIGLEELDEAERTFAPVRPLMIVDPGLRDLAGLLAYRQGDFQQAADLAGQVLIDQPKRASALFVAGAAHHGLGAHEKAREYLEPYLAEAPSDAEARRLLGAAYLELGEADKAHETLAPLAEGDTSDDAELLTLLGRAAADAGRAEEARRYYRRAIELHPDAADLRARLEELEPKPDEGGIGP